MVVVNGWIWPKVVGSGGGEEKMKSGIGEIMESSFFHFHKFLQLW